MRAHGAWLLADEVYLGAEIDRPRTRSFWGLGDRVIVTSGLSKAYGIPGVRVGWIVAPQEVVAQCWSQHDYLAIGPNKTSDRIARTVVEPHNREQCYGRTREILRHNLPITRAGSTVSTAGCRGASRRRAPSRSSDTKAPMASLDVAERVRTRQSTLIVPGSHIALEGYLRIWLGGREPFLREGLRRIGTELNEILSC